jgi:hypothetical protein
MEYPGEHSEYIELLVPDAEGAMHLFIERDILSDLAPDARSMVFIMDMGWRHHLQFDRPVSELLYATGAP